MKVLVTGSNGFVGTAVCKALLDRNYEVRALTRVGSDISNLKNLAVEKAVGDIRDEESLHDAIKGCSAVFHVAADYRLWVRDPAVMYDINVEGSKRVVTAALACGVERIVYTSSVAALAAHSDGTVSTEETPTRAADMIGHYKRSKYLAEQQVAELVESRDAPVVIVNPSTPVGPGDIKPTPTGRIIYDAMHGRIPAFVDTGLNIVHVDDVAAGHVAALEKGVIGRRYILGGEDLLLKDLLALVAGATDRRAPKVEVPHGVAIFYAQLAELLARVSGKEPGATVDGVRMSRKKMFYSSARARDELGYCWRPADEAVRDAVAWFRRRDTA